MILADLDINKKLKISALPVEQGLAAQLLEQGFGLYTPCVAAMGAIKNEVGTQWAGFAGLWSFTLAYLMATLCYQIGTVFVTPVSSSITIFLALLGFLGIYYWLKYKGNQVLTIPVKVSYS